MSLRYGAPKENGNYVVRSVNHDMYMQKNTKNLWMLLMIWDVSKKIESKSWKNALTWSNKLKIQRIVNFFVCKLYAKAQKKYHLQNWSSSYWWYMDLKD